jgi:hypothetical protein
MLYDYMYYQSVHICCHSHTTVFSCTYTGGNSMLKTDKDIT